MPAPPLPYLDARINLPTSRRPALADVHRHNQVLPTSANQTPATNVTHMKTKAESPRLTRQNTKTRPPSPPQTIRDVNRSLAFIRVGFLGEVRIYFYFLCLSFIVCIGGICTSL